MATADIDIAAAPSPRAGTAKSHGGRPTKAAAAERDERLLDIATRMFLEQGFDATSMDGLAEAAAIGKATLYARYADKGALFVAVLRRAIPRVYAPIEEEFRGKLAGAALEPTLRRVAKRLLDKATSHEACTLGRILAAQAPRYPDLAKLAVKEGMERQQRLVETVLTHFAGAHDFASDDIPLFSDLFISMVSARASRLILYGVPVDPAALEKRTDGAVAFFVRGLLARPVD